MTDPTILLISTLEWAGPVAARLAMVLHAAGCEVAALAPPHDVVRTAKSVSKIFKLRSAAPKWSIRRALQRSGASFVVPCDDPAVSLLHQLHAERPDDPSPAAIRSLIATSLGDPDSFRLTLSKSALIEHAHHVGIRVPDTRLIPDVDALASATAGLALPYMIKADGSWGGMGVSLVCERDVARAVLAQMTAPLGWARALKRTISGRTPAPLIAAFRRTVPPVTAQKYVAGRPAHRAVLSWNGDILAGISHEAVCVAPVNGAATVVRQIHHAEMEDATARLVGSLRLSGFCCCDFMIENGSENAFLLELNPRATQTCHLVPASGKSLAVALFEHMTGLAADLAPRPVVGDLVALFAREWARDPASQYLQTAYHDVPWNEPDFVLASMHLERRRSLIRRHWTDRVRGAFYGARS